MTPGTHLETPLNTDRERQVFVTLAMLFCLASALVGLGIFGQPVDEVANRALASDATLLAPAQWTFLIWRVIYAGLLGYVVWQWLPGQGASPLHRAVGWWSGWSMILAGVWVLVVQRGWLWMGVFFMLGLAYVLARHADAASDPDLPQRRLPDLVFVDGAFGLNLGWVCVAAVAMVAATLRSMHVTYGVAEEALGAAVLLGGVYLAHRLAQRTGGRWSIAAGFIWGFLGIAWERLVGERPSVIVGVGAAVAALFVLVLTWLARPVARTPVPSRNAGR